MIVQITCVKVGHRQTPKKQKAQSVALGFLLFPRQVIAAGKELNLLDPDQGAQIFAASEEGWRRLLETKQPLCSIARFSCMALDSGDSQGALPQRPRSLPRGKACLGGRVLIAFQASSDANLHMTVRVMQYKKAGGHGAARVDRFAFHATILVCLANLFARPRRSSSDYRRLQFPANGSRFVTMVAVAQR
jgi:hypothetical protein